MDRTRDVVIQIEPLIGSLERRNDYLKDLTRFRVKKLALICASSRGGSSMLHGLLKRSSMIASPRGEHVPYEKLYLPEGPHDALSTHHVESHTADRIWRALRTDVSMRVADGRTFTLDPEADMLQAAIRLTMQWPQTVTPRRVIECYQSVVQQMAPLAEDILELVTERLHATGELDRRYYDGLSADRMHLLTQPRPPHPAPMIEEPPFVRIDPQRIGVPLWDGATLLLKSSLNAYRIGYYKEFFPNAEIKVVHLTRNPAAAINGLMDGWNHWGFYSHYVADHSLRIRGYSERYSWGKAWWNFDRFPGWEKHIHEPLPYVAAEQWLGAHATILGSVPLWGVENLRVKYEDMIRGPESRQRALDSITEFLDVPPIDAGDGLAPAVPVMATKEPRAARWRGREQEILPMLTRRTLQGIATELGYGPNRWGADWI